MKERVSDKCPAVIESKYHISRKGKPIGKRMPTSCKHDELVRNVYNKKNNALSKRELETVYWLTQGKTVPEVALIMKISSRTVEKD